MKVKERKTEISVPHKQGNVVFIHPYPEGTLAQCAKYIQERRDLQSNSQEIASLIYDSWKNPKKRYESKIINSLKHHWIWEFTGNFYLPKGKGDYQNGIILWDGLEFNTDGSIKVDKQELIKKLEQGDKSVRFVPFGFLLGHLNPHEISKNDYMIARYSQEGAVKIAEVSTKYSNFYFDLGLRQAIGKEKVKASIIGIVSHLQPMSSTLHVERSDPESDEAYACSKIHAFGIKK